MRISLIWGVVLSLALAATGFSKPPAAEQRDHEYRQDAPFAFTNVTVIDPASGKVRSGMTVVVEGGRIASVGKSQTVKLPKSTKVIQARGKYLIPGLWDMHIHLTVIEDQEVTRDIIAPLLAAYGITGVRDMGGDFNRIQVLRREIEVGSVIGPRIISPGPFVDGPQEASSIIVPVATEDEARQAVRRLKSEGVDFIKVQSELSPDTWRAVLDEAGRLGISVVGHIPERISAFDVARSTQRSIEHISPIIPGDAGIMLACSSQETELRDELLTIEKAAEDPKADRQVLRARQQEARNRMITTTDAGKCASLIALLVKNAIYSVPTQIFGKQFSALDAEAPPMKETLKYIPRSMATRWENRLSVVEKTSTAEDVALRQRMFEKSSSLVGEMHRVGVKLMAGTDAMDFFVLPGLSLHQELGLMVKSGLTPMQALQTATSAPAVFMGKIGVYGTTAPGAAADLVLLDKNPLDDISNTQAIDSVVLRGKLLDRNALNEILARVRVKAESK